MSHYAFRARLGDFWPDNARPFVQQGPDIIIRLEPIVSWAQKRRAKLWAVDPCCLWCGFLFVDPDFATIEHLVPQAYGGTDAIANTKLACSTCNEKRGHWYSRTILHRARYHRHKFGCRCDDCQAFRRAFLGQ